MRRADRLFRLVQLLHPERDVTACILAQKLEVSERTIYRDIQDLSLSGVPIISETGRGYRLMPGFRLPPLMFDEDEIAALLLGVRMIKAWADQGLAQAAERAIEKIHVVIPAERQHELASQQVLVPDFHQDKTVQQRLGEIRQAIAAQRCLYLHYQRQDGKRSARCVHPLGLFYWGAKWTFVGWCELRDDFRHFRLDRICQCRLLEQTFAIPEGRSLEDYLATVRCAP